MRRSATISIIGRPNVGKSTLVNALVEEKISIVSPKPQTTRNRILGIVTKGDDQYIFVDTPGIHKAKNRLGDYMMKSVSSSLSSSDAALFLVDAAHKPGAIELGIIETLKKGGIPCVLILNKVDLTDRVHIAETITDYASKYDFDAVIPVSALKGKNVEIIFEELEKYLYETDWMYDEDEFTDQSMRQMVCEAIREKLLRCLNKEVPHGIAVGIEKYEESEGLVSINCVIYCEKQSHKSIIIGKNGEILKRVGTYAREDLEKLFGKKVFLELWVKVNPDWRESASQVYMMGYDSKDL